MSSYIIAGSSEYEELGQCEQIANKIKSCYKNIDFRIVIKHPKEWAEHIQNVLRIYGFKKLYNPIVYTLDGKLIGGLEGFKSLAEKEFGLDLTDMKCLITPEINMKIVEKEVALKKKHKKGKKTLAEKIQIKLREYYNDGVIGYQQGIYQQEIDNGVNFFVKREDKLCPKIVIPNELNAKIERDIVLDEDIDLEAIRKQDSLNIEAEQDELVSKTSKLVQLQDSKREVKEEQTIDQEIPQEEQAPEGEPQENEQNNEILIENKQSIIQVEEEEQIQDIFQVDNNQYFPTLFNLKPYNIKKMKFEYFLAFHPEPLVDGQMILFEKYEENQNGLYINDYSRTCQNRKIKKVFKQNKEENPEERISPYKSRLYKDNLELQKPLGKYDWKNIKKVSKKLDSIITLQILPFGQKTYQTLSNTLINVFMRKFLINTHMNQGVLHLLLEENSIEEEDYISQQHLPFEKYILERQGQTKSKLIEQKYLQIPSLSFPHLIYIGDSKQGCVKKLKKHFRDMVNILFTEKQLLTDGLNCILTRKFMMLVPLRHAYSTFEGHNLFLSPLAYLGFVHLPVLTKVFPRTAYEYKDKRQLSELLRISAEI